MNIPDFQDEYNIHLRTEKVMNVMYAFYPEPHSSPEGDVLQEIVRTGFFVNLRVLFKHGFGRYLDPNHPLYPTPVNFEVVYKEILHVYDVIFPLSSLITPFTEAYFQKGWRFIKLRMAPSNWHSASYMPSSRDLSIDQWELFCKWVEQLQNP